MRPSLFDDFMATFLGGLLAGVFFPSVLLTSMVWQHGIAVALEDDAASVLLMSAMLGTTLGLISGAVLGFPAILILRKVNLDRPLIIVGAGAALATFVSYFPLHLQSLTWSTAAPALLVGALCGTATCRFRRAP